MISNDEIERYREFALHRIRGGVGTTEEQNMALMIGNLIAVIDHICSLNIENKPKAGSNLGACDNVQILHSVPHQHIIDNEQNSPPFPCVNWHPLTPYIPKDLEQLYFYASMPEPRNDYAKECVTLIERIGCLEIELRQNKVTL